MSLTNPRDVVTEERLSEFYQRILPYLGGMPEILANKFSKGDLYSTDEKMIGRWIDGKPVYQITLTGATVPASDTVLMSGVDTVVNAFGSQCYSATTQDFNFPYIYANLIIRWIANDGNVLVYRAGTDSTALTNYRWTFQYTKTTDQPISIGVDTDYSTDEKIVGTWIDGKPLYQKTISCGAIPNATSKSVALNITNLGDIVSMSGAMFATSGGIRYNNPLLWVGASSDAPNNKCAIYREGNNLVIQSGINLSVYDESYITIQYTKTTD